MGNVLLDAPTPGEKRRNGSEPEDESTLGVRGRIARGIRRQFDLREDAAYEGHTIEAVRAQIRFRGANLWILMFAILICSIGLNVNSTAVIIGAMLISPLMGPILGIGTGAATSDSSLLIDSLKNLGIATLAAVSVSALYFAISPLHEAQSELLARTAPTLWDVLIATFGGFAGIIAVSRREKSNAIPGVAIATALMPPICTVGYSLATGQWLYLAGAFYLYFINLTFIAVATFVLVRFMRFPQHRFVDEAAERRTKRWIYVIAALVAIPSFYTAYMTVQDSVLQRRVSRFVTEEFTIPGTQVVGRRISGFSRGDGPRLTLMLLGKPVDEADIALRRERLREYALEGLELEVIQSGDLDSRRLQERAAETNTRLDLEALYREAERSLGVERASAKELRARLEDYTVDTTELRRLLAESRALYPAIERVELGRLNTLDTAAAGPWIVRVTAAQRLSGPDLERYGAWLRERRKLESVVITQ